MNRSRLLLTVILGWLAAIGPFSIDMYLPGFSRIAKDLHSSVAQVSLSLSSFFVGISFGQLLYGPLLDRYGRKKPLLAGLVVYIITSFGCAMAVSVQQLIFLRFLQALGSCAGLVASRAMVRDLFPVSESARIFSHLMLIIGISPIVAPSIGSFLVDGIGWHAIFLVLGVMMVILLVLVVRYLPESFVPDGAVSLKPGAIVRNYRSVFSSRLFVIYAISGGLASSGLYAYLAGSPYVYLELFGLSEKMYGLLFAFIAAGLIICSQLNNLLLRKMTSERIVRLALPVQVSAGLLLFFLATGHFLTVYLATPLIFIFIGAQGFVFPNTSALAMKPFSLLAGSASALLGTLQMGIGSLSSAATSWLSNGTALPMTGVMTVCSLLSLLVVWTGEMRMKKAPPREQCLG